MAIVYLALGSNVGDSKVYIDKATSLLAKNITGLKRAPLYTSKAVGFTDQADFTNTAIRGKTTLSPRELLRFVKEVEKTAGRVERFRWGPREIDIDIIIYDNIIFDIPDLHIPHTRFAERDFVLRPMIDLTPNLVDPRSTLTVSELYARLPEDSRFIFRE